VSEVIECLWSCIRLKVDWKKTSAVSTLPLPRPAEVEDIEWQWEAEDLYSKPPGFHFGQGMSQEMIWNALKSKLDNQISQDRNQPYFFMELVAMVNQVFMASDWNILALWAGNDSQLKEFEEKICQYLWKCRKQKASCISHA
jgi:hypothetical protein